MICNNYKQQLDGSVSHTSYMAEWLMCREHILPITYNYESKKKRMYKRRSNSHVISRGKMMALINIGRMFDLI